MKQRLWLALTVFCFTACSGSKSVDADESYLTDVNLCEFDFAAAQSEDPADYGSEQFAAIHNSGSSEIYLAQRLTVASTQEFGGLQLRLKADSAAVVSFTLALLDMADISEFTAEKEAIDTIWISASQVPVGEAGWVTGSFNKARKLSQTGHYWIVAHGRSVQDGTPTGTISWSHLPGSDMLSGSTITDASNTTKYLWSTNVTTAEGASAADPRKASYRLLRCQ